MGIEEDFEDRFHRQTQLDDLTRAVYDSVRFRDHDASTKASAILTFSGLLIAACMVQYTSSSTSVVYMEPGSMVLKWSVTGFFCLAMASFFSMLSMVLFRRYSRNVRAGLLEFDALIENRRKFVLLALVMCLVGTSITMFSLFLSIYK